MRIDMGNFEIVQAGESGQVVYLNLWNRINNLNIYTEPHVLMNLQRNILYRKCKLILEVENEE